MAFIQLPRVPEAEPVRLRRFIDQVRDLDPEIQAEVLMLMRHQLQVPAARPLGWAGDSQALLESSLFARRVEPAASPPLVWMGESQGILQQRIFG